MSDAAFNGQPPLTPNHLASDEAPGSDRQRHLHLVDLENLGVTYPGAPVLPGTGDLYRDVTAPGPDDQFIVGADATRIFDLYREFPGSRLCVGRGPDGGELAVLRMVDLDLIVERYDALTIASGDGLFAPVARLAQRRGLPVRVVSRRNGLARSLRSFADEIVMFPLWVIEMDEGDDQADNDPGDTAA
jgi:hypothetical protein